MPQSASSAAPDVPGLGWAPKVSVLRRGGGEAEVLGALREGKAEGGLLRAATHFALGSPSLLSPDLSCTR